MPDSTRNSTGAPSSTAPTTNSSASAPRGTSGLHAVEHEAVVACGSRWSRRRARRTARSARSARARRPATSSPVNAGQVGLLLLVGAPQRRCAVATAPGASAATARPMSPLASASATRVPAIAERSSEMPPSASGTPRIGSPISRLASSSCLGRGAGSSASAAAGRTHLGGELGDHVDEHLLVLGRGQVEDARGCAGGGRGRRASPRLPARAKVAAGGGDRLEAAAGRREDGLLGLLAQPEPVEQVALGEPVEAGDGEADRVARLSAATAVPAARA